MVKQLRKQAKDGTLAEVLQLPVILWHVRTDSSPSLRNRREAGSGDYGDADGYDDNYDDNYEDNEDDYDGEEGEDDNEDSRVPPTYMPDVKVPEHPHRHHHGEETIDWKVSCCDACITAIVAKSCEDSCRNKYYSHPYIVPFRTKTSMKKR